jgi:MSHA pilin protein MshA
MSIRRINQGGFTLIELVVVITILGILAAFAVPRFTRMEVQARIATVQALGGSVRSSAALTHALWLASGQPANVPVEGVPAPGVAMVSGYPSLAMIDDTISDLTGFTYNPATGVFQMNGVAGACNVTYAQAPADGAPTITVGVTC